MHYILLLILLDMGSRLIETPKYHQQMQHVSFLQMNRLMQPVGAAAWYRMPSKSSSVVLPTGLPGFKHAQSRGKMSSLAKCTEKQGKVWISSGNSWIAQTISIDL
jgi:hypothetical protein